jgi:hypothetical protein
MARQRVDLPTDLQMQLDGLAGKMRRSIIRKGLRRWSRAVRAAIRSNLTVDDKELKSNIRVKVKSYRRGSKIWIGVGVADNETRPQTNPGLRVAMYEGGWRPWPKGKASGRTGKDWRRGLRRVVSSTKVHRTMFMSKAQAQTKGLIIPAIREELDSAIRRASEKGVS